LDDIDPNDPNYSPRRENPRMERTFKPAASIQPLSANLPKVKVCIITESRPWNHERAMEHGEVVEIPEDLAKVLIANKHAALVV
jgi:hypothetical protein